MDTAQASKASPQMMLLSIVSFSCFGGVNLGFGFRDVFRARSEYQWIGEFLIGSAFVCWSIYWAILVARRVNVNCEVASK